jgi:hypothetical protein
MRKKGLLYRKQLPILIFFCLLMLAGRDLHAQFYNGTEMTFGKNRIQYKEFLWTYYKFDKFDIYFYLNGKELAVAAAKYATEQIPLMESRLEITLNDKIQFLVFNNLTDLKQSNIGLIGDQRYNTGGITHILGGKVFLYFDGSQRNFERQIRYGIANLLLNQIMYGASIGSQIKNTTLFNLPDWYKNGLISYIAEEWNTDIDNRVKDGILSGRFNKFNHLAGEDALYAGHSLWKYIADKYGKAAVTDIVNMSQISKSVENGFLYVIGISFKTLVNEWLTHFRSKYEAEETGRVMPEGIAMIPKKIRKDHHYYQFKLSPDGNYSTYVDNESGRYKLFLVDEPRGKKKVLMRGGFRLDEKVDYSYPLVAWHPTGKIMAVIVERKGEIYLYFYNMEERQFQHVILYNFEKIVDFTYSPDGRELLFSAVQKGQSDLYLYNIAAGSQQQLTDDIYDDLNPVFLNDSRWIIFASNRTGDTLQWNQKKVPVDVPRFTDLFIYDRSGNSNILKRVTNTVYTDEIQPVAYEKGSFSYLSDANGIVNRYLGRLDSTISFIDTIVHYRYFTATVPLTNYSRNILEQSVSVASREVSEVIFYKGNYRLYKEDLVIPERFQPIRLDSTSYIRERTVAIDQETIKEKLEEELQAPINKYNKRFRNVYRRTDQPVQPVQKQAEIDINNYIFDKQAIISPGEKTTDTTSGVTGVTQTGVTGEKEFTIPKRLNYNVEYSINQLATQLDFTSLNFFYQPFGGGVSNGFSNLGLNGFFQVGLTDLLEDHRIVGGFRIPINLSNIEYLFSYSNLKQRLDKEIVFVRQATEEEYNVGFYTFMVRFRSYQAYYILKYPFSPVLAVSATADVRYQKSTLLSTNEPALKEPDINEYWGGLKGEITYDDTKDLGLNLYTGTRFKIFGEYTQILGKETKNMVVLGLDIRNYQRIHRVFIWANRLAASTSFGQSHLIYFMGGVDNWLSPRFDQGTPIDFTMNYAYQALATNMRGFNQNARNGNNFVVLNSELRFPVFRYLFNRPIKSDFVNNFQIVGFGDLGLAWAGTDPYSDENSFYTRIIQDGSLWIKVREQKEPLIGGFGCGARTRIFGYFLRGDLAWGVEDRRIKQPIFYLSLSLDF